MYPAGLGNDVELLGPDAEPVIAGEPGQSCVPKEVVNAMA